MDINGGVNPAQSDTVRTNLHVESERVTFHTESPPPYEFIGTVTNQPVIENIIIQPPLKDAPIIYNCPGCRTRVRTKVVYSSTRETHMLVGFICGFTCWCFLCCLAALPYMTNTFKKTEHFCSNCDLFLGSYSRF